MLLKCTIWFSESVLATHLLRFLRTLVKNIQNRLNYDSCHNKTTDSCHLIVLHWDTVSRLVLLSMYSVYFTKVVREAALLCELRNPQQSSSQQVAGGSQR